MIRLTRLQGEEIVINADLIEFIERTPDTVITMVTGRKVMVRESVEAVIEKVVAYSNRIGRPAAVLPRVDEEDHATD